MDAHEAAPVPAQSEPTRVFLSYSRRDAIFLHRLAEALDGAGYAVDFDQSERDTTGLEFGISAQDRWWLRLKEMIAAADVMVFVISPASIASRVCDDEIAYAASLGKRVIPVLRQAVDWDRAPERLRALNVKLDFTRDEADDFARTLTRLRTELATDLNWHRRAVRLARLAHQWDADGRPEGQLLRAGAISDADGWAARRPTAAPVPGPLLLEFLSASREKEERDRVRLQTSELNARLRAADALVERALVHLERAAPLSACECLTEAVTLAPPSAIPDSFVRTLTLDGWARTAWTAAACIAAALPHRVATYEFESPGRSFDTRYTWFDRGRHLLGASKQRLTTFALTEGRAVTVSSIEMAPKIAGAAAAASAPRTCVLTTAGDVEAFESGVDTRARVHVELCGEEGERDASSREFTLAAIGLDANGETVVVSRVAPDDRQQILIELLTWDGLRRDVTLSFRTTTAQPALHWVGFSADGSKIGVACDDGLHVFERTGARHDGVSGRWRRETGIAADLSAFATAEYDLVQLFRRREARSSAGSSTETETLVLQGATSMVADAIVMPHTVVARDLRGRLLEWRPRPEVERGMTMGGARITQSFGTANRLSPSNRLEGVPQCDGIAAHPQDPDDLLVITATAAEHWRLVDATQPLERISLGASARVAVEPESGVLAAATERGLWIRQITAHGDPGTVIGPAGVVWDVAVTAGRVAATCHDGSVRIWSLGDRRQLEYVRVEANPFALAFSPDGTRLFIGLENGVLWEWAPPGELVRIGALGIGTVRRLRVSADGSIGIATGQTLDDIDDDRMNAGIAVWSPVERRILWTTERYSIHPHDADISRDGAILFVAASEGALAMSPASGEVLGYLRPPQSDASKPDHVTAICCGPDGRTTFLGLWDGSIVHCDILSNRILSTVKAQGKYVSGIAADPGRGVVVSASPAPFTGHVAVWRGWRVDFFREREPSVEWIAGTARSTAENHGRSVLAEPTAARRTAPRIVPGQPDDLVAEARLIAEYDDLRAGDLLAAAVAAGRGAELSSDERALAGQALLANDTEGGLSLLREAAAAGSANAHVAIGLHLIRNGRGDNDWQAALPYFRQAAEHDHAHAAYLLGYYHDRIEKGHVGAVNWRSIAKPTGIPVAQDGRRQLAQEWYRRAAAAGSEPARQRLAEMDGEAPGPSLAT